MFISLLPDPEKRLLLDIIRLLSIADKSLLWDGKIKEELTSSTDLTKISMQVGEEDAAIIKEYERAAGMTSLDGTVNPLYRHMPMIGMAELFGRQFDLSDPGPFEVIKSRLLKQLKELPINKVETPESRVTAARSVMTGLLEGKVSNHPESPKIMLLEMILVALRNGSISSIEFALLKDFQFHYSLQDFIFDELLERAEALNNEINKAIAIIFE